VNGTSSLALALSALLLGGSPPAVRDAKGDSRAGHADIASVSVSVSAQSVTWRITAYGRFTTSRAPCVDVQSVLPSGLEWVVCGNAAHGFAISRSSPYRPGGGHAGRAVVTRPNASTIVYRVSRKAFTIGSNVGPAPQELGWQVEVRDRPDCYPQICDRAPDSVRVLLR
jgi:hypothetical protein